MEKRNNFVTVLCALIPGAGYMYLGLMKKGIQLLVLFLVINPILSMAGLWFLKNLVLVPFWLYTFFDTLSLSEKLNRGESVKDWDYIFERNGSNELSGTKPMMILAGVLILIGVLALFNQIFKDFPLLNLIKNFVASYFVPVCLILAGVYLILKNSNIGRQ